MKNSASLSELAVLLPVDMGNYKRNNLPVREMFEKLRRYSKEVEFIAYHWRRSGNFIFIDSGETTRKRALEIGEKLTALKCLTRRFSELRKVLQTMQPQIQVTKGGAMILPTPAGPRRLIHVALSHEVMEKTRRIGEIASRVEILAWPSPRYVLCLYNRPSNGGDVGHVTNKVLAVLRQSYFASDLHGTGRTLGVIRDLLENRGLRAGA